ncbi:MAG: hypothetical protein WA691_04055 [Thermoplasmata archaeon]
MTRPLVQFFRVVLVVFIAAIVVAEVLIYAPPAEARISASVDLSKNSNGTYEASYRVTSTFPANVNATATVAAGGAPPADLYFYYDASYPSSWSYPVWSFGLSYHVDAVLTARGLSPAIVTLDANQLRGFLTDPADARSILFMPTGVIPDTVYNLTTDLLAPWIRAGGTLVWFADTIGYYSGQPNTPLSNPNPSNPGWPGVAQFVNASLFGSSALLYVNETPSSRAYNFNYGFGIPAHGMYTRLVQAEGGEVLGETYGNYTNAARLPLGNGTIDYFSVPMEYDDTELSVSLATMLQSGALTGPFQPVALQSFFVPGGSSYRGSMTIVIPNLSWANSTTELYFVVYQSDLLAIYGNAVSLPLT